MKKYITLLLIFSFIFLAFAGTKGRKVAVIKMARGKAVVVTPNGEQFPAVKGKWIIQGSVIKTRPRSFVRLSFIDKSTVNVGPSSEMKIEKFSESEAGVLNVISGKIRSKVTKDYLQMEKNKSKLYVKSKSAVMGVRGTEFVYSYNPKTDASTAVLFEGSIVFNKINPENMKMQLEDIVNRGQMIAPGQFSVVQHQAAEATVPAKMSSRQLRALKKNDTFTHKAHEQQRTTASKSIVPPGLSGAVVSSDSTSLEKGIQKTINSNVHSNHKEISQAEFNKSKGFVKGNAIKPADGSIVHIDSGTIIPLGSDSVFDKNQGEWVSGSVGGVDTSSGDYLPPQGYKITDEGKLLKLINGGAVQQVVIEVKPLDQVQPLNQIETTPYVDPKQGPAPAGTNDTTTNKEGENKPPLPVPGGNPYIPSTYPTDGVIGIDGPANPITTPTTIRVNGAD